MSTNISKNTQTYSREQLNEISFASDFLNEHFNNNRDNLMVVNDLEAAKLLLNNVEPLIDSIWESASIASGDFKAEILERLDVDDDFISLKTVDAVGKSLDLVIDDALIEVARITEEIHDLLTTICKGDEDLSKELIVVFKAKLV
jgi:hypothetical protein